MLVVKIGGAKGIAEHIAALAADIAACARDGARVVVAHGGSAEADELGHRLGVPPRRITSPSGHVSRYTDQATLEVVIMAMAGAVNTALVRALQNCGLPAVGLSGVDGGLLRGTRKEAIRSVEGAKVKLVRDDFSASISSVNTALLGLLLDAGYVPVVCPLVLAQGGEACNVDADRAAAAIARAMGADALILLSNVPGLLRDAGSPGTLLRHITLDLADRYEAVAAGRMKTKYQAAVEAARSGVARAIIADARRDRPVSSALAGQGTVISA
ncbi:MAG: [LysW]-aminoadipate kinase [Bacillota bacterium]|nr:[LysW]-aminoadipate kinase [Bacillota bacterium]